MDTPIEGQQIPGKCGWQRASPLPESSDPSVRFGAGLALGTSQEQLASSWSQLIAGKARVFQEYSDRWRHYLVLAPANEPPLPPRELERWRPILLGMSQKAVAVEIGCASSTVASSAARCLHLLGLDRTSRAAPMSIVMMAHASQAMRSAGTKLPEVTHLAESVLVSIERPDLAVGALLSRGEAEVLRLRVDGLMLRAIASERATSERTVANQLASAYTKLGVSGRSELLASLVQGSWRRRVGMVRGAA